MQVFAPFVRSTRSASSLARVALLLLPLPRWIQPCWSSLGYEQGEVLCRRRALRDPTSIFTKRASGRRPWLPGWSRRSSGFSIIRVMCASCFTAGDFRCSGPVACWRAPMPRRRTDGTVASIPALKKMYGPPPRVKENLRGLGISLQKCIRPTGGASS